ncbi:putative drug exporter of the RND superfamily [Micrococcales bacterium KH10]|nr:putative drug exporter of the RND superfamily [Micrococcales bacterium KH10]
MTNGSPHLSTAAQPDKSTRARQVPTWLRVVLPTVLIVVWFTIAGIGGPYFGKVSEVSSNDQTTYLPQSAEATQVQKLLGEFNDSDQIPAIVVFVAETPLTDADMDQFADVLRSAEQAAAVTAQSSPPLLSDDGLAAQAFVPIDLGADIEVAVTALGNELRSQLPDTVEVYVTGPAGLTADLTAAFAGIDGLLLGVALLAVFIILILVYRSFLLPIAVLITSMFALCAALLTVWWLAKWEVLLLNGQTQGILFILVIGAATDYSLLFVARYREELRINQSKWIATSKAIRGSIEPILASGGTVIAGLLCLLLSDLRSNSALGPVASIGIVFAILSALTLLPAILLIFGRAAFWPRKPRYEPVQVQTEQSSRRHGLWARIARLVERKPRHIWLITTLVLLAGMAGVTQLNAVGVPQSDLVLGSSEARDGQVALGKHFPGGSGSPAQVIVPEDEMTAAASVLLSNDAVADVSIAVTNSQSGTALVLPDGIKSAGPPGEPEPQPKVIAGQVLLQATLTQAPDSDAAAETIVDLREELSTTAPGALVGGVTATAVDTNQAAIHDRNLIIPIVLVVITLILMLLLRAVIAPVLLILTTVLSFGTAMGISAWMFNGVFNFPGAEPAVPLYGFIFLVALGIDYNIFLMTRVREESMKHGTRQGVLRGLSITGGVITSAGLVLAATFAALAVVPILFLAQLAFIVAFGVLLDTFVVRTALVPALVYDIGARVWWPSKLAKTSGPSVVAHQHDTETVRRQS